jgi:hypothetical protein
VGEAFKAAATSLNYCTLRSATVTTINNQAACCPCPPQCEPADRSNPTHASTSMQCGQAVFENDNYRITANDNNSVTVNNKNTGETYEIWGDPHVKVDGQQDFDFWGKTTFALEDGTKITIDTTPFKNDPSMTLASEVTITNGDYGVRISGVDSNTTGDLKVQEAAGYGRELDAVTSDGNVLQENPAGKGFLAVDDQGHIKKVDQDYINKTDSVKTGKLEDKYAQALEKFKSLVSIAFEGVFVGGNHGNHGNHGNDHGTPRPRPNDGHGHAHHHGGMQTGPNININIGEINIDQHTEVQPRPQRPNPFPRILDPLGIFAGN